MLIFVNYQELKLTLRKVKDILNQMSTKFHTFKNSRKSKKLVKD